MPTTQRRRTSPAPTSTPTRRRRRRSRGSQRVTAVGMAVLLVGVTLVLGVAGASWQARGTFVMLVGAVLVLADNTGQVFVRRSSRHRRSSTRAAGAATRWVAPVEVIDLRSRPAAMAPPPEPPLRHPRVSPPEPAPVRRRRPGPR